MRKEGYLIEQAEKIELLNAEIETLQAKWEAQGLMIQKLHRENQRYKQALEKMASDIPGMIESKTFDYEKGYYRLLKMVQKALVGEK